MEANDITAAIIGAAVEVHRRLGPGLLESAYRVCLAYELRKRGLEVVEDEKILEGIETGDRSNPFSPKLTKTSN